MKLMEEAAEESNKETDSITEVEFEIFSLYYLYKLYKTQLTF